MEAEEDARARRYFKSETTPEEAEKIKRLRVMQKKHELELEQKAKAH